MAVGLKGDRRNVDDVTPNEIARSLGVTGLQFRNWLREQKAAGHALLAGHQYRARYRFTRAEADQLAAEFRSGKSADSRPSRPDSSGSRVRPTAHLGAADDPFAGLTLSDGPGHRVTETWMGEPVTTLADLLRPGLRAVVVGINPSPVSVAVGHYYQGQLGQRFYKRLEQAGVMDLSDRDFEDDVAFAAGIGFTDVVKRPTRRSAGLRPGELRHGRAILDDKLAGFRVSKVLFTFKAGAEALLGSLPGHGLIAGQTLAGAEVFVMPGPMERSDRARRALEQLADWWAV